MSHPRQRNRMRWLAGALTLALAVGCGSGGVQPPRVAPAVEGDRRALFPSPTGGYQGDIPAAIALELEQLHAQLLDDGATATVWAAIEQLAARESNLPPAKVLLAELLLLQGQPRVARERLVGIADPQLAWTAPLIVDGAAAAALDDVVGAWRRFREAAASGANPVVARRAAELEPRAVEILGVRIREAVARGHLEEAVEALYQLETWVPGLESTYEATAAVAAATGDDVREETAIVALLTSRPGDRLLRERLADLMLRRGDASGAIGLLQQLLQETPGDPVLLSRLSVAKLRFRLGVLPPAVQALAKEPVLRRAGLARLLFWLVPGVRIQAADNAPIATDILDRTDRAELVRVLGWGLLEVQPGVHEFAPERAARRRDGLLAALRAMRIARVSTCADLLEVQPRPGNETLCRVAAECGLIDEPGACLPEAELAGSEAVAILGRALEPR